MVRVLERSLSLAPPAAATAKCACSKAFSRYNKLAQNVMAMAKWSKTHALLAAVLGALSKTKPCLSKYPQAWMKAIEFV